MCLSFYDSKDDLDLLKERFIKKPNGSISKNIKKFHVISSMESTQDMLYEMMRNIKKNIDEPSKKNN